MNDKNIPRKRKEVKKSFLIERACSDGPVPSPPKVQSLTCQDVGLQKLTSQPNDKSIGLSHVISLPPPPAPLTPFPSSLASFLQTHLFEVRRRAASVASSPLPEMKCRQGSTEG